jgi:hypothetical protein
VVRGAVDARTAVDRLLIAETANRYAWAYDPRELAVLVAVFVDDAVLAPIGRWQRRD